MERKLRLPKPPPLTGTEKQVPWAEQIRSERIRELARIFSNEYCDKPIRRIGSNPESIEEWRGNLDRWEQRLHEIVRKETTAHFWISTRLNFWWY